MVRLRTIVLIVSIFLPPCLIVLSLYKENILLKKELIKTRSKLSDLKISNDYVRSNLHSILTKREMRENFRYLDPRMIPSREIVRKEKTGYKPKQIEIPVIENKVSKLEPRPEAEIKISPVIVVTQIEEPKRKRKKKSQD